MSDFSLSSALRTFSPLPGCVLYVGASFLLPSPDSVRCFGDVTSFEAKAAITDGSSSLGLTFLCPQPEGVIVLLDCGIMG